MNKSKKVLIICQSSYNKNTLRIAEAMARVIDTKIVTPKDCKALDLDKYDVIGFGSGINFHRHHHALLSFVEGLPKMSKDAFIFSTRANPFLGKYHLPLRRRLREKGFRIIGEFSTIAYDGTGPFSIIGGVHKGRPHEGDKRRAEKFARQLNLGVDGTHEALEKKLKKARTQKERQKLLEEDKQVHHSDWKGRLVCVDWHRCIGCGKCVNQCPLNVYDLVTTNGKKGTNKKAIGTRDLDCVRCRLCKNQCPAHAIMLCGTWKDAFRITRRHADKHLNYDV